MYINHSKLLFYLIYYVFTGIHNKSNRIELVKKKRKEKKNRIEYHINNLTINPNKIEVNFNPTGRICVQHPHGPRHLHLARWQFLWRWSVQWYTAWDWNLQMCKNWHILHRAVGSGQEARKGMIFQFIIKVYNCLFIFNFFKLISLFQGTVYYNQDKTSWYKGDWVKNNREGWGERRYVLLHA